MKALGLLYLVALALGVGGWIANIVKLVEGGMPDTVTVEFVLRILGILFAPIGAVMGFV